ncbi:hypothetical protein VP01_4819g1 [Puccinia sorghi]|uniref:Uncharacterized protein n=1 Tax=Puccinia sorghi TaxID=27349 RepID=A0A0L6UMK4_9BASI|nr:hypothetical protein VP01_4819g1 [Puccinia sorghi]
MSKEGTCLLPQAAIVLPVGVKLLLRLPSLPSTTSKDDLFLIFDSIANEFIQYTRLHPASTQAELDARIHFFLNLQWAFRAKRDIYASSCCF